MAVAGLVAVVNGLLVGLPALLLALLPRSAAVRATGRAWLAAAVALVLLGVVRAVPIGAHELYLLVTAVVAVGSPRSCGNWPAAVRPRRDPVPQAVHRWCPRSPWGQRCCCRGSGSARSAG